MEWSFILSGAAVGLLVGMTGVGGGAFMTPLLVTVHQIPPLTAVGTDLLFAAATKALGTTVHGVHGSVDWRKVALLAAGSLPASWASFQVLQAWGADTFAVESLVKNLLGLTLLLTAMALLFGHRLKRQRSLDSEKPSSAAITRILTVLAGIVLGVFVTFTSVGAGALGVVVLFALYPALASVKVVGTDLAHAVPLTLLAGAGHAQLGTVDWTLLGWLLVGSLPAVYIGSRLSASLPQHYLRYLLASMLCLAGVKLFVS